MRFTLLCAAIVTLYSMTLSALASDSKPTADAAAAASNQFGLDLYQRLSAQEKGNLFFSPYSIETALVMTSAGAVGTTQTQMAQVLHLGNGDQLAATQWQNSFADLGKAINTSGTVNNERVFDLVVANALWPQKGFDFNPIFVDLVKQRYGAGIEPMDYAGSPDSREQARKSINSWVEKITHDKIKDLIGPGILTEETRLVLTNAIYFKGGWEKTFAKHATSDEAFHADAATSVPVPTMHQTGSMNYVDNADFQAVGLPYKAGRLSMIVLLPRQADGLAKLEKSLSNEALATSIQGMQSREVQLSLPKFTFTSQFGLGRTLTDMGMTDAFSGKADFSGISSTGKLAISDVIHKAFVDVNEEGTEAAAATAVVMGAMAMPPRPQSEIVKFQADHPFLFLIRENSTGAILFMGRIMNPKG